MIIGLIGNPSIFNKSETSARIVTPGDQSKLAGGKTTQWSPPPVLSRAKHDPGRGRRGCHASGMSSLGCLNRWCRPANAGLNHWLID